MVTHDRNIFLFKHSDQAVSCGFGVISQRVVWLYPDCTVIDGLAFSNQSSFAVLSWKRKTLLVLQQAAYL